MISVSTTPAIGKTLGTRRFFFSLFFAKCMKRAISRSVRDERGSRGGAHVGGPWDAPAHYACLFNILTTQKWCQLASSANVIGWPKFSHMCVIEDGCTIAAFGVHDCLNWKWNWGHFHCWLETESNSSLCRDIHLFFFLFGVWLQCVMSPNMALCNFFFLMGILKYVMGTGPWYLSKVIFQYMRGRACKSSVITLLLRIMPKTKIVKCWQCGIIAVLSLTCVQLSRKPLDLKEDVYQT